MRCYLLLFGLLSATFVRAQPAGIPLDMSQAPPLPTPAQEVQYCWSSHDGCAEFELRPDDTFWFSNFCSNFHLRGTYRIGIVDGPKQYVVVGGFIVDMNNTIQLIADDPQQGRQIFWIDFKGNNGPQFYWQNMQHAKWPIYKKECPQVSPPVPQQPAPEPPPGAVGDGGWLGNGSGFVVHPSGLIATNRHVVQDASAIEIEISGKNGVRSYSCVTVAQDPVMDLALIQIVDPAFDGFPPLPYSLKTGAGSSSGTEVYALGYPKAFDLGSEIKVTSGIISATTGLRNDPSVYTLSVPIQPGNSGGPLLDMSGHLIGINSSKIVSPDVDNISYAIKSRYLAELIRSVAPGKTLPAGTGLKGKSLRQQVEMMSEFVPMIKIK